MEQYLNHDGLTSGMAIPQNVNPDYYIVVLLISAIVALAGALAYVYKDSKRRERESMQQFISMHKESQELAREMVSAVQDMRGTVHQTNTTLQGLSQLISLELHKR